MAWFETVLELSGYPFKQACQDLVEVQEQTRDEFLRWQTEQRWAIVKYHHRHCNWYREKVGKHLPDRWEDVPQLSKSDLQRPLRESISDEFDLKQVYVSSTSGSSGTPFFFAKDRYSHALTWALIKHRYALYELALDSKQARFYGIPLEKRQYLTEMLKDKIMNRVRFPVFDLSDEKLSEFYERFKRRRFAYIYGYTQSLVQFARFLINNNLNIKSVCHTLTLCITTAEVCTNEDRRLLERAFHVPVVNEYGASELGVIAFEFPDGRWLLSEETLFVELVDSNLGTVGTGKDGEIVITSLFNKAMPIIRYRVGDLGHLEDVDGPSIYYRQLRRLTGRTNDLIHLPSGRVSAGLTFYYISRTILETSGVLKEFIIKQEKLNKFVFEVVTNRDLSVAEIEDIKRKLEVYLEPNLELQIRRVPRIERSRSGKIKHFHSMLNIQ